MLGHRGQRDRRVREARQRREDRGWHIRRSIPRDRCQLRPPNRQKVVPLGGRATARREAHSAGREEADQAKAWLSESCSHASPFEGRASNRHHSGDATRRRCCEHQTEHRIPIRPRRAPVARTGHPPSGRLVRSAPHARSDQVTHASCNPLRCWKLPVWACLHPPWIDRGPSDADDCALFGPSAGLGLGSDSPISASRCP